MAEEQRLVVSLEARVREFEKKLAASEKKMAKASKNISTHAKRAGTATERELIRGAERATRSLNRLDRQGTQSLRNLGNAARDAGTGFTRLQGIIGGAFAGASIGGMIQQVRQATEAVAELNKEAKVAGLDNRTFQEFQFIARRARVSADALTDGFKELQLRADEFAVTGKGPAAEAFARLGFDAETVAQKLQDPIAFFDELIEKVRLLDRAAQIRIFDEIFGGTGGEQFVALLDQSIGKMSDLRQEAHQVGAVLSDELIAKGVELDQRIADITSRVQNQLTAAFINAGTAAFTIADALNEASTALDNLLTQAGNSTVFQRLNQWLAARGLLDTSGMTILDDDLRATVNQNAVTEMRREHSAAGDAINRQRAIVEELEAKYADANEEAKSGIQIGQARVDELQRERDELTAMVTEYNNLGRAIREAEQAGGVFQPGSLGNFGPAVPSNISGSDARKLIIERAAHNNVNVSSMKEAAAAGAAAALMQFPELRVSSAYRSPAYNAAVGGASQSRHISGDAVDFVGVNAQNVAAIVSFLRSQGFNGFGYYNNGSLHADMRENPAAWGPNFSASSLNQTPQAFQQAVAQPAATPALDPVISRQQETQAAQEQAQAIEAVATARNNDLEAIDAQGTAIDAQIPKLEENAQQFQNLGQQIGQAFAGAFSGFIRDLVNGKDAVEALRNALTKLADQLLNMIAQQLFSSLFGGLGGGLGLFSGGGHVGFANGGPVRRYASGGFVSGPGGPKADKIPAMLSNGEYVINAAATKKFGPLLAAINQGKFGGFSSGGSVGGGSMPSMGGGGAANINIPITVNVEGGSGKGDVQHDQDQGRRIAKEIEAQMRHTVVDELRMQMRNGGMLNNSMRR